MKSTPLIIIILVVLAMVSLTVANDVCKNIERRGHLAPSSIFLYRGNLYIFDDNRFLAVSTARWAPSLRRLGMINLRGLDYGPGIKLGLATSLSIRNYMRGDNKIRSNQDILYESNYLSYTLHIIDSGTLTKEVRPFPGPAVGVLEDFFKTTKASTMLDEEGREGLWFFYCRPPTQLVCVISVQDFYKDLIEPIRKKRPHTFYHDVREEMDKHVYRLRLVEQDNELIFISMASTKYGPYPGDYHSAELPKGFIFQQFAFMFDDQSDQTIMFRTINLYAYMNLNYDSEQRIERYPTKSFLCPPKEVQHASESSAPTTIATNKSPSEGGNVHQEQENTSTMMIMMGVLVFTLFFVSMLFVVVRRCLAAAPTAEKVSNTSTRHPHSSSSTNQAHRSSVFSVAKTAKIAEALKKFHSETTSSIDNKRSNRPGFA